MAISPDPIPRFSTEEALNLAQVHFGLGASIHPLCSYSDQNFHLRSGDVSYVLKFANATTPSLELDLENHALAHLHTQDTRLVPSLIESLNGSDMVEVVGGQGLAHRMRLLTFLPGILLSEVKAEANLRENLGGAFASFDLAMSGFRHLGAYRQIDWDLNRTPAARTRLSAIHDPAQRALALYFADAFDREITPQLCLLRYQVIHGDGNPNNILVQPNQTGTGYAVSGIFDFGDMVWSALVHEVAIVATYAMLHQTNPLAAGCDVVRGFHRVLALEEREVNLLYWLIGARLLISVSQSAAARQLDPDNAYATSDEKAAWRLLDLLVGLDPAVATDYFRETCGFPRQRVASPAATLIEERKRHLNPALSLSYTPPLKIVRGWRQFLYDEEGTAYLDCVNNVCHVGHSHPHVVAAATRQMAQLNTNTRYLHDHLVTYAQRLLATFPPELSVVTFVCSGSEANDLAQRMARTHTQRHNIVVLEAAYHGNTTVNIEISPYKYARKGGPGRAPHIFPAALPDPFRGIHRGPDCASAYAEEVRQACEAAQTSGGAAAFIAESVLGCGGQIVLPAGYLQKAYAAARSHGAVCIADEVQVGFGRVGSHFWAFQSQDVIPDIVTLGKPMGNGHPLAAVITTPAIAASFKTGMEYFNTFGGNPVSCAIGLAVLDVIEQEQLQANAREVGCYLLQAFQQLKQDHPLIGDVRGLGLFLGIELVQNQQTLEPATAQAARIANRLRERHILISTDGPYDNVLKIKPPLVFTREDAARLVAELDAALRQL